jgi:serine O-acetyltransferase
MFENIRADYALHKPLRNRALWALAVYRFGRWSLAQRFAPLRWITSKIYGVLNIVSEIVTGVVMDRNTRIGKGFHIMHPEGVRIHPQTVIGDRVGIMHRVTMGYNMYPGAPVIGDDVFIGCGASILGKIKIGNGARIAANSLVVTDVPPDTMAMGVPARIYRLQATRHGSRRGEDGLPGRGPAQRVHLDDINAPPHPAVERAEPKQEQYV